MFVVWRAYSRRSPAGRRSGFFRDPLTAMALLPSLGHLAINKENYGNFASETPQPLKDPSGNTVFPGFPADILAAFRLYSVMAQLILWTTIGVLFAPLAEKLLTPTPPAPVVEDEPATV